ncbi:hypothetical protein JRQ81_000037 [Phrynocephalus forsythii]|uniref:Uncharacterized protein n=1 Tax=Phrynocephalus forsythii TaxID=171643 RepID=A0A9Q0X5C3_9SAUR|nr:hypothetical protein JRQ81_000037 [Phrynocephalus forsythii]
MRGGYGVHGVRPGAGGAFHRRELRVEDLFGRFGSNDPVRVGGRFESPSHGWGPFYHHLQGMARRATMPPSASGKISGTNPDRALLLAFKTIGTMADRIHSVANGATKRRLDGPQILLSSVWRKRWKIDVHGFHSRWRLFGEHQKLVMLTMRLHSLLQRRFCSHLGMTTKPCEQQPIQ